MKRKEEKEKEQESKEAPTRPVRGIRISRAGLPSEYKYSQEMCGGPKRPNGSVVLKDR